MNEDEIFDTPADAVKAAQTGYVLVRGTLFVDVPGGEPWIQLCDSIVDGACVDGAVVTNIDPLGPT